MYNACLFWTIHVHLHDYICIHVHVHVNVCMVLNALLEVGANDWVYAGALFSHTDLGPVLNTSVIRTALPGRPGSPSHVTGTWLSGDEAALVCWEPSEVGLPFLSYTIEVLDLKSSVTKIWKLRVDEVKDNLPNCTNGYSVSVLYTTLYSVRVHRHATVHENSVDLSSATNPKPKGQQCERDGLEWFGVSIQCAVFLFRLSGSMILVLSGFLVCTESFLENSEWFHKGPSPGKNILSSVYHSQLLLFIKVWGGGLPGGPTIVKYGHKCTCMYMYSTAMCGIATCMLMVSY